MLKKYLIGIVTGVILTFGLVYATEILMDAKSIGYSSEYTEKTNVADVLTDLLTTDTPCEPILVWTNPNPTASFGAQTITFTDAPEDTKYFLIVSRYYINTQSTDQNGLYRSIIKVGTTNAIGGHYRADLHSVGRQILGSTTTSINFGSNGSDFMVPWYVYAMPSNFSIGFESEN